jgi:hypothetical protein
MPRSAAKNTGIAAIARFRVRITCRSPINCEAKREVPPRSLAEQRSTTVLPLFSTIACAGPSPKVVLTKPIDWNSIRHPSPEASQAHQSVRQAVDGAQAHRAH